MSLTTERIDALERRVQNWEARLAGVEEASGLTVEAATPASSSVAPPAARATVVPPAATPNPASASASAPTPVPAATPALASASNPAPTQAAAPVVTRPSRSLEQLLGGRVLAYLGGAAIIAGLAFLFALGVSGGWLDEGRRCALGALAAAGLVVGGALLHERRGRTTAALAAVGAGIAGLYLAIAFATTAYELLPDIVGAVLACGVGALGTALALRWDARAIAVLGLLGAVLSPLISGAIEQPGGLVLLWIASAAGVAVVVGRRWGWMGVALAVATTPQWIGALAFTDTADNLVDTLLVLVAFGILGTLAAIGHELRAPAAGLRPSSAFLLAGTALTLGLSGYALVDEVAAESVAMIWLGALAVVHLAAGLLTRRAERITGELALLVVALGVGLADVAFASTLDGPPRVLGWTIATVGFAFLARRARGRLDPGAAYAGLGLHIALAALGAVAEVGPALSGDAGMDATAGMTLAAFAAGALASARLAVRLRGLLDVAGLAALAVLAALTLDGAALTLAWAAEAVALTIIARRSGDDLAAGAAVAHVAGALIWCLADQAPLEGLGAPVADLGPALLGLAALAPAAGRMAWAVRDDSRFLSAYEPLAGLAGLLLLYLASLTVVAVQPGSGDAMQGQLQLSALWAAVGVGALVAGLKLDVAHLRAAALALLALSAGKLFLVDLATLAAAWRVAACIAVGLLLLLAAFVHARLQPEAPAVAPD